MAREQTLNKGCYNSSGYAVNNVVVSCLKILFHVALFNFEHQLLEMSLHGPGG